MVFATIGVTIAQFFRLKNEGAVNPPFGFFTLGIPLACAFIGSALVITVVGSWRFWRQQNALARGKIHVGGWEINTVAMVSLLVGARTQFPWVVKKNTDEPVARHNTAGSHSRSRNP